MSATVPSRAAVLVVSVLLGALAAGPVAGQTELTEHTLRRAEGSPAPEATVADAAWLQGHWMGRGLGAVAETTWLSPTGGSMVGIFRLVRDGRVQFYEMVTLTEEEGSLVLRLKHFGPDLVGWEEKEESVTFPLVRLGDGALWFDGLTMERAGEDRLRVWAAFRQDDGSFREALFEYRRAEPRPTTSSPGG